jgi:hypothetical protein
MSITAEEFTKRTGAPPITTELTRHEYEPTGKAVEYGQEWQCLHCKWYAHAPADAIRSSIGGNVGTRQSLCCDPQLGARWPDPKADQEPKATDARVVGLDWRKGAFVMSDGRTFELPSKLLREHGAPTP